MTTTGLVTVSRSFKCILYMFKLICLLFNSKQRLNLHAGYSPTDALMPHMLLLVHMLSLSATASTLGSLDFTNLPADG